MHRAQAFFYVCAGVFLLALAYHFGAVNATAQGARASGAIGRFTVVSVTGPKVEGPMLVDTATGDTWDWSDIMFFDKPGGEMHLRYWHESMKGFAAVKKEIEEIQRAAEQLAPRNK